MRSESERQCQMSVYRPGNAPPSRPNRRNVLLGTVACAMAAVLLLFGVAAVADDDNEGAAWLREFIAHQVGGLTNLKVPARNEDLPLPRAADGTVSYRYELTEAKRYLGKLLFHDPVRTVRININTGQPKDLPTGTDFGGTFNATDPLIQQIFPETASASSSVPQGKFTCVALIPSTQAWTCMIAPTSGCRW